MGGADFIIPGITMRGSLCFSLTSLKYHPYGEKEEEKKEKEKEKGERAASPKVSLSGSCNCPLCIGIPLSPFLSIL